MIAKGGKRAIEITEILAKNAVSAVEQIAKLDQEHHVNLDMAKRRITSQVGKIQYLYD